MRKQLFQSVCDRLQLLQQTITGEYFVANSIDQTKSVFVHFDLWNQQLDYLDEEQPFNTPAVFIEFMPIKWRQQSQALRDATVTIRIHVVTRRNIPTYNNAAYGSEALNFFDLLSAVNLCLHGHKGDNFGTLTGTVSETDNNFDELMHSIEQYETMVTDIGAVKVQKNISARPVIE